MIQLRSMRIALRHFLYKINAWIRTNALAEMALKRRSMSCFNAGVRELTDYDTIVSDPLATRYVAKFMHRTGLLAQFQHTEQEESDDETGDLEVMEQSPEDAGYSPMHAPTVEEGENLDSLFEYTLPDCAGTDKDNHLIEDGVRA
ncbi:hypothetical protein N7532_007206 [Penicillium argentinense]|uniref:Uncharacterized protein n=1 Tax=Penicillium argentinense TaxID=1131581 RepID=A0A9W9F7H8_9EURO|nr:uncharacterized protein N7532_007206 [Penicillium argentinense]KAJ5094915.1 hypothetical protein N7532_007206 [Penicillium argentinense]